MNGNHNMQFSWILFAKQMTVTSQIYGKPNILEHTPQALVSFKKYMPPPLPYFKVNICPFPLPHFASIFFAYL
jgi:hypothetical protein